VVGVADNFAIGKGKVDQLPIAFVWPSRRRQFSLREVGVVEALAPISDQLHPLRLGDLIGFARAIIPGVAVVDRERATEKTPRFD
jgi:hypothetical protein